jgi:2-keto-4-pentenoate hydratase/2-oxohepta-3-ene-1,7-dioic acid hydratase in catechol pathway
MRNNESRLGVLLDKKVVDVQSAYQEYCRATHQQALLTNYYDSMLDYLKAGTDALKLLTETIQVAQTKMTEDKDFLFDLYDVILLAPISNPGKVICIGGNFPAAGKLTAPDYPIVFLKPASNTRPGMRSGSLKSHQMWLMKSVGGCDWQTGTQCTGDASNYWRVYPSK